MTVAEIHCRHCSARVERVDRFCWGCGTRLNNRQDASSAAKRQPVDVPAAPRWFGSVMSHDNPLFKAEVVLCTAALTFGLSALVWSGLQKNPVTVAAKTNKTPAVVSEPVCESEIDRLMKQARLHASTSASTPVALPDSAKDTQTAAATTIPAAPEAKPLSSQAESEKIEKTKATECVAVQHKSFRLERPAQTSENVSAAPVESGEKRLIAEKTRAVASPTSNSVHQTMHVARPEAESLPSIDEQIERDIPAVKKGEAMKPGTGSDVATYNKLLEKYFAPGSVATADGGDASTTLEPPTYEEWLAAGKPQF